MLLVMVWETRRQLRSLWGRLPVGCPLRVASDLGHDLLKLGKEACCCFRELGVIPGQFLDHFCQIAKVGYCLLRSLWVA